MLSRPIAKEPITGALVTNCQISVSFSARSPSLVVQSPYCKHHWTHFPSAIKPIKFQKLPLLLVQSPYCQHHWNHFPSAIKPIKFRRLCRQHHGPGNGCGHL
nr:hypothetical protein Itr_chr15CG09710 [Ipomoea trifida]